MSQHTPGPWTTERRSATIAINDAGGSILGEVYGKTTRPELEWHANARLIAAAPDLLHACRRLLLALGQYGRQIDDLFGHDEIFSQAQEAALAAIAKAVGKE